MNEFLRCNDILFRCNQTQQNEICILVKLVIIQELESFLNLILQVSSLEHHKMLPSKKIVVIVLLICAITIGINWMILSSERVRDNISILTSIPISNYQSLPPGFIHYDDGKYVISLILMHFELEILYIRLTEHWNVVDEFHIFESPFTHQQKPKPFYLKDSFDLFKPFHSKIKLHQIEYSTFDPIKACSNDTYKCEVYERDYMMTALTNNSSIIHSKYDPKDVIIIMSDLDEIPSEGLIKSIRNDSVALPVNLQSKLYKYSMHWFVADRPWRKPAIISLEYIQNHTGITLTGIRRGSSQEIKNFNIVDDGWHLSTFGSLSQITRKASNMAAGDRSHSLKETIERMYRGELLDDGTPYIFLQYVPYENDTYPNMRIFDTNPFFARAFLLQYELLPGQSISDINDREIPQ